MNTNIPSPSSFFFVDLKKLEKEQKSSLINGEASALGVSN